MKANDRKRAIAEDLYINAGWTAKDIAGTVKVTENTVGNWIKKFGWKETRENNEITPHKLKNIIREEMVRVMNGEPATFNADDLSKLSRAYERLDQKVSIQVIISVLKELDEWMASQDVDNNYLEESMEHHKAFLHFKIESESL